MTATAPAPTSGAVLTTAERRAVVRQLRTIAAQYPEHAATAAHAADTLVFNPGLATERYAAGVAALSRALAWRHDPAVQRAVERVAREHDRRATWRRA